MSRRRIVLMVLTVLLAAVSGLLVAGPAEVEKRFNEVLHPPPYRASERAAALHRTLSIADLHSDSLLWGRDLLERGGIGHVDLPRLQEGNVALQAFFLVTKTPKGQNIEANGDDTDNILPLALLQRWPAGTWRSLMARAVYQAKRLEVFAAGSNGALEQVRTSKELAAFLEQRRTDGKRVASILGIEGAHALDDDPANLDALYDAGIRIIGLAHFFDNVFAGSAHGLKKGGLTEAGRALVQRMEARQVLVDLAHASAATIDDVLAMATRPVLVSHTGVRGTCDNNRNLSDAQLAAIARTGGVVGIGYWDTAVCGTDARAVARAIRYTARRVGIEHVALGSDFDGATTVPFDTTGLVSITDALLAEGLTEPEIRRVMGENVLRLLASTLPVR